MRIAIVGAGPAGLVSLYTLERSGIPNLELVCYDRATQPGGEWIFTEDIGVDEYGLPVHGSMYRGMQANLPKQIMTLHPDFPWPDEAPVFPYREQVLDYLCSFASKFNLTKHIRFLHYVHNISRSHETSRLTLDVEDLKTRSIFSESFDYLFICCGKHGVPYIPHDTSKFTGRVLHYHDMKDPLLLAKKRILIIGSAFGAMDMILHLLKVADTLYLSYHNRLPFFGEQSGVAYKPQVNRLDGHTVYFVDGSSCDVDVVLYATGFSQMCPLSGDLALDWGMGRSLFFPLYKHVVHPACPSIIFVGCAVSATILVSRIQAEFGCAIIKGLVQLPNKEEMLSAMADFRSRWTEKLSKPTDVMKFLPKVETEMENADDIARMTGCSSIPINIRKLYYSLIHLIVKDMKNYHNYSLRLIKTNGNDEGEYEFFLQSKSTDSMNGA